MMAWPPDSALAAAQPDRAAFVSDTQHLKGLNSAQRAAVTHIDGPLLILAGAGTGKTKTLVHRIAHLIRSGGVPPSRILAVTFTNRAAEEMRERVHAYVGAEARAITLGTFHALGVRILREHGARLGLPQRFAIYATGDQLAALRSATSEISIADDRSVALMTMHSAKGLEFRDVFIVGVEEGILPHTRSLDDAEASGTDALAEERRLFYVGVTRARERLSLSWCRTRRRAGSAYDVLPSRYLDEIPPELCERISPDVVRAPEESQAIRENFFASMKRMFAEEPDA